MLADKGNSPPSGPDIVPESGHVAVRWISQFQLVLVTQRSAFTAVSVFSPKKNFQMHWQAKMAKLPRKHSVREPGYLAMEKKPG